MLSLGDLARDVANLRERHAHALRRYGQEARTLPGLAYGRLVLFGSDLNPEPPVVESDEDFHRLIEATIRDWDHPKAVKAQRPLPR
jgi:hypothetical protein